jgi:hypothetical protein
MAVRLPHPLVFETASQGEGEGKTHAPSPPHWRGPPKCTRLHFFTSLIYFVDHLPKVPGKNKIGVQGRLWRYAPRAQSIRQAMPRAFPHVTRYVGAVPAPSHRAGGGSGGVLAWGWRRILTKRDSGGVVRAGGMNNARAHMGPGAGLGCQLEGVGGRMQGAACTFEGFRDWSWEFLNL